jgi:dTDP-4-dehydrorhamnose reductase/beta-phosphoglucomutase-like phosphatase (HAD superfamily)
MKVMVCGASGLLGRDLCRFLCENNITYVGTYFSRPILNGIQINFENINDIVSALVEHDITVCVNCIVERQVDTCENNWSVTKKINIDMAANIAKACHKVNVHMVHISTDYVFDGKYAPYYPDSATNPLQNYGISKLISENRVTHNTKKYTIVRVPVLYSDTAVTLDENAVTLIGKKVLNRILSAKEDNYSVRRPNYIPDFCHFLGDVIREKYPPNRIYHFNNPHDNVTKYEMATMISTYLNKENRVLPIDEEPNDGVDRPRDTYLMDNHYNIIDYAFTPLQEGLELCFRKLYHPPLDFSSEEHTQSIFFLMDLDGTLLDSHRLHYEAYSRALKECYVFSGQPDQFTLEKFDDIVNGEGMDAYLQEICKTDNFAKTIKNLKNEYMRTITSPIQLMPNADKLIEYIHTYNINHAVVTNTSKQTVETFMKRQPKLQLLKNWVTREDYTLPKPGGECFLLGIEKFHKSEPYVVGIENTISGHRSLQHVTKCIYMMMEKDVRPTSAAYTYAQKQDVYIINDFMSLCK